MFTEPLNTIITSAYRDTHDKFGEAKDEKTHREKLDYFAERIIHEIDQYTTSTYGNPPNGGGAGGSVDNETDSQR